MSKKNSSNKNKKNTKSTVALLRDNTKQRRIALIGLALSCLAAIIIFGFVLPGINNEEPDDEIKQTVNEHISLKLVGSGLVEDKQYNVWFDIVSIVTDGTFTITPRDGVIMKYDNNTGETTLAENITSEDIGKYSFIWIFDKPDNGTILTDMIVTVENTTIKKNAGFYLFCDGSDIGYLSEQQYTILRKAEDNKK